MTDHLSLRIALLDKQIVDADRLPIGRIDDLEIELPGPGERPRVVALLTGAQALGERLEGGLGNWLARTARRLRGPDAPPGPARLEPALVDRVEPLIRLGVPFRELRDVAGLERWLASHLVEPIPGAGDASK